MTLLFFDAMQEMTVQIKPEWSAVFQAALTGRDGQTYGAACPATSLDSGIRYVTLPDGSVSEAITGFAIKASTLGDFAWWISFVDETSVEQLKVGITAGGLIKAVKSSGAVLLGTSTGHTPISAGDWAHVQVDATLDSTDGSVVVRLYDVEILNLSGISTATRDGEIMEIGYGADNGGNRGTYDDLWICDTVDATSTQGRTNDTFLGDLSVALLLPSGDGAVSQFAPSTGSSNYGVVDEVPIDTADYVSDDTSGDMDLYDLTSLPTGATDVYAVRAQVYAEKSAPGSTKLSVVVRESDGTVTTSDARGIGTTWASVTGDMLATRPSDGGTWDPTDVNALQVGQEVV